MVGRSNHTLWEEGERERREWDSVENVERTLHPETRVYTCTIMCAEIYYCKEIISQSKSYPVTSRRRNQLLPPIMMVND